MKKISWLPEWAQKIADFGSGQEPDLILPGELSEVEKAEIAAGGGPYQLHRCPKCDGALKFDGGVIHEG